MAMTISDIRNKAITTVSNYGHTDLKITSIEQFFSNFPDIQKTIFKYKFSFNGFWLINVSDGDISYEYISSHKIDDSSFPKDIETEIQNRVDKIDKSKTL